MCNSKKSCWNCVHSKGHRYPGHPGSYWEQPEPAMVEDCSAEVTEEAWDIAVELLEKSDVNTEDSMPGLCGHYKEETVTCFVCKKKRKATKMEYWYGGDYTCKNDKCINEAKEMGL